MPPRSSRIIIDSLPSYKLIADNTTPTESSVRRVDDHDGGGLGSPARIEAVKDVGAGGPLGRFRLGTKTSCTAHQFDQPSPNFGRWAERASLTGGIFAHSCDPETSGSSPSRGGMTHFSIPLLHRGNAFCANWGRSCAD